MPETDIAARAPDMATSTPCARHRREGKAVKIFIFIMTLPTVPVSGAQKLAYCRAVDYLERNTILEGET